MEIVTIRTRTASGKWIFAFVVTLFFQFLSFAQDPGDFGAGDNPTDSVAPGDFGGGNNPTDESPAAPIDDYVWVLMVIGIGFAFYKYKVMGKQTKLEIIIM